MLAAQFGVDHQVGLKIHREGLAVRYFVPLFSMEFLISLLTESGILELRHEEKKAPKVTINSQIVMK